MTARKKILVVIDPTSEEQPAFSKATELARRIDAELTLLTCLFDPDIARAQWVTGQTLEHIRDEAIDAHFESLERLAEPLRSEGLSVSAKIIWDNPLHEAIVREALNIEADFVVKDTHHHSAVSRALFTNTDWHLIRECPCPLWLVKPTPAAREARVMAAVDPVHEADEDAALDRRIVDVAQLFSVLFEERLQLVHVFTPPPPPIIGMFPTAVPTEPVEDMIAQARQAHAEALNSLATDTGVPAGRIHLREGSQIDLLPATAGELHAGVVVMGAVARSALRRLIIGHTAERTLERFPCDVVIVKSADFESPIAALPPIYGSVEKSA